MAEIEHDPHVPNAANHRVARDSVLIHGAILDHGVVADGEAALDHLAAQVVETKAVIALEGELVGEVADAMQRECYVVGGYVRDIFLERPSCDIDVVVVGSGIEVATELKKRLGRKAHLSVFKNFGTAQVKIKNASGTAGEALEV